MPCQSKTNLRRTEDRRLGAYDRRADSKLVQEGWRPTDFDNYDEYVAASHLEGRAVRLSEARFYAAKRTAK